jgi:membrane dipeptidase
MVASAPEKFAIATSVADVRRQFEAGIMSLPMGMENGSPIDGDLDNLQYFYDRGIRYLSLCHGSNNHLSDSSYDETPKWNGISEFGAEVITIICLILRTTRRPSGTASANLARR